jgi:hypothetical protein
VLRFGFVLRHFPFMLCMAKYIEETPPTTLVGNIYNEIKFIHTCIDCGGVCSIYGGFDNIIYL